MIKIPNEVKVGILTITGLVVLFFGYKYLKGSAFFNNENVYYSYYEDIGGLLVGNPVQIQGFKIGTVENIEFMQEEPLHTLVKVGMRIDGHIKVPQGSKANIVSTGLMGNIAINIIYPPKDKLTGNVSYLEDGAELNGTLDGGMMEMITNEITPIRQKSTKLMESLDSLSTGVNEIMRSSRMDNTLNNVDKSFATLEKTLINMNNISAELQGILKSQSSHISSIAENTDKVSGNFLESSKKLDIILSNATNITANAAKADISGSTESLKKTMDEAQIAVKEMQNTLAAINSGNGSIGKLMNDEKLYENLERASDNLDKLLSDLRENPSDYVHFSLIKLGGKKKD